MNERGLQRAKSASNIPLRRSKTSLISKRSERMDRPSNIPNCRRSRSLTRAADKGPVASLRPPSTNRLTATPVMQSMRAFPTKNSSAKSSTSRSRSPFNKKYAAKMNDKKWLEEQHIKVKRFLESETDCDLEVLTGLKPPTIANFVHVISTLFKKIDRRIDITKDNYKETVIHYLKCCKYPANISVSTLKTVNTMHTWPHIISIFVWLVDLITVSDDLGEEDPLEKPVSSYICAAFRTYYTNAEGHDEDVHLAYIRELLMVDDENNEELEIERLESKLQEQYEKYNAKVEHRNVLVTESEKMVAEIKQFEEEDPLTGKRLKDEITNLREQKSALDEEREQIVQNINIKKEIIANQKYTVEDKKQLMENLNELKYSVELKKVEMNAIKELKDEYDDMLVKLKQEVQKEIYRINSPLLKQSLIHPDMMQLQLPSKFTPGESFYDEIKKKEEKFKLAKISIENEVVRLETEFETLLLNKKNMYETIEKPYIDEEVVITQEMSNIQKSLDDLLIKMRCTISEFEIKENEVEIKLKDLVSIQPDLHQLKSKKADLEKEIKSKKDNLDDLCVEKFRFFKKMRKDFIDQRSAMVNTMETISENYREMERKSEEEVKLVLRDLSDIEFE